MFSDIFGYTAIMGRDEEEGVRMLAAHRELLRTILLKFNGWMRGEIGDGWLTATRMSFSTGAIAEIGFRRRSRTIR